MRDKLEQAKIKFVPGNSNNMPYFDWGNDTRYYIARLWHKTSEGLVNITNNKVENGIIEGVDNQDQLSMEVYGFLIHDCVVCPKNVPFVDCCIRPLEKDMYYKAAVLTEKIMNFVSWIAIVYIAIKNLYLKIFYNTTEEESDLKFVTELVTEYNTNNPNNNLTINLDHVSDEADCVAHSRFWIAGKFWVALRCATNNNNESFLMLFESMPVT